ncbi:MAG: hypothetical protein AAF541_03735 [Pseudomonadota bacterium]
MRTDVKDLLKKIALGGTLVAAAAGVQAASDGTVGASSTGSVELSLEVEAAVKISNLLDIDLGTFATSATLSGFTEACIYSNSAAGYTVTATSASTGGTTSGFQLHNGADALNFSVEFDSTALAYNTLTNFTGARTIDDDCSTGNNTRIDVEVDPVDASSISTGTYLATLTLLIAPQ